MPSKRTPKKTATIKVRLFMQLGLSKQEEIREYEESEIPEDEEKQEEFLRQEWMTWSANWLDGGASIIE